MILLPAIAPQVSETSETAIKNGVYPASLFTAPQFFKPEFCAQVRMEVRQFLSQSAQVLGNDNHTGLEPTVCRADEVQISQQSWEIIEEHLVGLKSQLEQCFKTDLSEMESPSVVHYYQADSLGWHPQNRTIGCFQFTHSPSSPACSKGNALRHLNLLEMKRIMLFKTNFSRWTAFFSNFPKILSRFLSISSWLFISIPLLSLVPTNNLRHL